MAPAAFTVAQSWHAKLSTAAAKGDAPQVKDLIARQSVSSEVLTSGLRNALQVAAGRGHEEVAKYLLEQDAGLEAVGNEASALSRAVDWHRYSIIELLLENGANTEVRDKCQRTLLASAAFKADVTTVRLLLKYGADFNARDVDGQTVLLQVTSQKPDASTKRQDRDAVIDLLLGELVDIEEKDKRDRTVLHWAAVNKRERLLEKLLLGEHGAKASIEARERRNKTALHCAAENNHAEVVAILLRHGADARATSDGAWTALHIAAEKGHTDVAKLLLDNKADCNAETAHGRTPLHWAASNGHLDVVNLLLGRAGAKRHSKDNGGASPLMLAVKNRHVAIVQLLYSFNEAKDLSKLATQACKEYNATITDFFPQKKDDRKYAVPSKPSVYDLLYGSDLETGKPAITVRITESRKAKPAFRWIHLPANNMAWVEALITKYFMEGGSEEIDSFRELANSLSMQHRGNTDHSQYMKPSCHRMPPREAIEDSNDKFTVEFDRIDTKVYQSADLTSELSHTNDIKPTANIDVSLKPVNWPPPRSNSGTTHSNELIKENAKLDVRPPIARRASEQPLELLKSLKQPGKEKVPAIMLTSTKERPCVTQRRESKTSASATSHTKLKAQAAKFGNIAVFMPYLHFETDQSREHMKETIKAAFKLRHEQADLGYTVSSLTPEELKIKEDALDNAALRLQRGLDQSYLSAIISRHYHHYYEPAAPPNLSRDEKLIYAYLLETSPLHPRRTLDQFYCSAGDTEARDQDQVVYRYCRGHEIEPKLFMVDQLWMWILSKDLIITSFPQRWQQPASDLFDILDGITEDVSHIRVKTVYDLASRITNRCSGLFYTDRHHDNYQFLDMFENSIGNLESKEPRLTTAFNDASMQAKVWFESQSRREKYPKFDDYFMNIGKEMRFLAEVKDIRNELKMISTVLEYQQLILPQLKEAVIHEIEPMYLKKMELRTTFDDQVRMVEEHLKNIEEMDNRADDIYDSVDPLLDLKQKYAAVLEARYAREQATSAARQGRTVIVFTVVTILFLPMSFMATFFAIDIQEFPRVDDTKALSFDYVSKHTFGIGLAISISLIIGALTIDYATTAYNRMTSSPGSLGSLRWMSIFRRHQDDSSEQNTADHRDPRRSSTGLSRVSARTATGTKGRISFALPRANQSSHLLLPFKQKERTYSRISNRSLRKVHANRDLEKGSGREW